MVWSQYVYEATVGCDTDGSEDDIEIESESHLNIHDWGVEYSDELWYLWDMIKIYLYDAMLENTLFQNVCLQILKNSVISRSMIHPNI